MPEFDDTRESLVSRLTSSPRALAAAAATLLAVAVVAVVVVLLTGSSAHSTGSTIAPLRIGTIALPAADSQRQDLEAIYTPGSEILIDPTGVIQEAHALGFDRIKVPLAWASVAPGAGSRTVPRFDAADPAAYPASGWAIYDEIIRLVLQDHMKVDLTLAPDPPLWAEGRGEPTPAESPADWDPDAAMFERFAEAVGTRYSGHYTPKGQKTPLPRVDFWSIWNEPNTGALGISPETIDHNRVESAPYYYRRLADAAWTALHATGHGHDVTLIGELAPVGDTTGGQPGNFSVMVPLRFLRALYCVGTTLRPLRGRAATLRHCPATAAGSRRFAAANPVLFHATAFAQHPYPQALAPDKAIPGPGSSDDAELAVLPRLFSTLDRLQRAYGSSKRFDVYDTEYGYQTSPPDTQAGYTTPAKAARWLNWSEYISWRLPRLLSYDQYLFEDPAPTPGKKYTKFATGIETAKGVRKPGWYAFRMPIWLPVTREGAGEKLEVWGCVRPAKIYPMAKRAPAEIQLRAGAGGAWKTVATVSTRTSEGYFDVHTHFPASGLVRIRWSPPSGPALLSRTTSVAVG